jgi:hypothetical protein
LERSIRPAAAATSRILGRRKKSAATAVYRRTRAMNENFSLIVMCLFLLGSLAFLAQQLTSYH